MANDNQRAGQADRRAKGGPDGGFVAPPPAATNHDHPAPAGTVDSVPGAGVVQSSADVSTHEGGPGREAPEARNVAPGAQRAGTTEGRTARAARGGGTTGGLDRIETSGARGQTAFMPATGGTGAPQPGSSGIRATSDPNFTAQHAEEEGEPSPEALNEQARRAENSRGGSK